MSIVRTAATGNSRLKNKPAVSAGCPDELPVIHAACVDAARNKPSGIQTTRNTVQIPVMAMTM
jgi:hypothetical protein